MKNNKKPSVQKYFKTRLKNLSYHECYVNSGYKEQGLAQILISKKQPSGKYAYVIFLLDIFCLGLKNTQYNFNLNDDDYEDLKEHLFNSEEFIVFDVVAAHNLIYGTIDCAEEIGFKPHKSFAVVKYMLDSDLINDGIDEIELGKEGRIIYITGPFDDTNRIARILEKTVGKGNFEYIVGVDEVWGG